MDFTECDFLLFSWRRVARMKDRRIKGAENECTRVQGVKGGGEVGRDRNCRKRTNKRQTGVSDSLLRRSHRLTLFY